MMKSLNNFLEKAHLFKVYVFFYFLSVVFTALIFYLLDMTVETKIFRETLSYFKLGAAMGIIFSLMFTLMVSMQRKSIEFWDYAKFLEKEIEKASTKEQLQHIWHNEYVQLVTKCQGGPQIGEVKRIRSIIETRYKYWKD